MFVPHRRALRLLVSRWVANVRPTNTLKASVTSSVTLLAIIRQSRQERRTLETYGVLDSLPHGIWETESPNIATRVVPAMVG